MQTHYDYLASSEHGALYTETVETRVADLPVPGQSTRQITWITAEGQRVREEIHLFLSDETWELTASADYEFDTQNRWIKRTRGNGRITERSLMCDGRLFQETDENGILTTSAYDSARQLIETTRAPIMDGATVISPETITAFDRDAAARILSTTVYAGAMETENTSTFDLLGRRVASTDSLGRLSTWSYSANGLSETQTLPSGATLISRNAPDGTLMEQSGSGQRHLIFSHDLAPDGVRTVTKALVAASEIELSREIVNGLGEILRSGQPNTLSGHVFTRFTYNAIGQRIKTQIDAENSATTMAPTLWEYDSFGNQTKETWQLAEPATPSNSRLTTWAYGREKIGSEIYQVTTTSSHDATGAAFSQTSKTLVSALSATLESKQINIDPRENIFSQWTEYGAGATRIQKSEIPSSNLTASATAIDNFTTAQTDHAGVTSTQSRAYTATGVHYTQTDGRGNATLSKTDLAGREISVTDAADHTTTISYAAHFDLPATVTNALGQAVHYEYDTRGRKIAEYGTATQPLLFAYDEADRQVSLTTFRVDSGDIVTDPTGRSDGDLTTWEYDEATSLLLKKIYADATHEETTYNALNWQNTVTDARGLVTTSAYGVNTGLRISLSFSDSTLSQQLSYNQLDILTQVTDTSGVRTIDYDEYNELLSESLLGDGKMHLVTENRDSLGRNTGYTYAKEAAVRQTVITSYAADGRIATAEFLHGGVPRVFSYNYLANSHLLETLAMPNNMTLTQSYETKRDLLTGMRYHNNFPEK